MGAWNLSTEGKESKGILNQLPDWGFDQYKQMLWQAQRAAPTADWLSQFTTDQYGDMYAAGFGDPWQMRQLGEQILPYQGVLDENAARIGQMQQMYGQVPSAGQTAGNISSYIDELGGNIARSGDQSSAATNDAFQRMLASQAATHGDIVGNIGDVYGGARGDTQRLYGGLMGAGANTYGDLTKAGEGAFGEMRGVAERTNPIGEFAAGRTARSFGPMMRAAMGRLRAANIDPNSPAGISALRGVEAERGRSMDDVMANYGGQYADRMNQILAGEQGMKERLGLGQLQFGSDLARESGAIDRNLLLGSGQQFRDELLRNLNAGQGLEQALLGLNLNQIDTNYDRAADYLGQRQNAALLGRNMGIEDYGNQAALLQQLNEIGMTGLGLSAQQYGMGQENMANNLNWRNQMLNQMANAGQQQTQNQMNWYGMANAPYQLAQNAAQQSYANERANSGWLKKGLAGIGGMALNAFLPGAGSFVNNQMPWNNQGQPSTTNLSPYMNQMGFGQRP